MKADMADKEMLECSQSKYEEEVQEKCSIISEQKAVRSDQLGYGSVSGVFLNYSSRHRSFVILLWDTNMNLDVIYFQYVETLSKYSTHFVFRLSMQWTQR